MSLRHGRNCGIYINGVDLSGDLNEVNPTSEQELADVTCFGDVGHTSYPGLAKDKVTIQAIYDNTEKAVFEALVQTDPGYGMMIAFGQGLGDPAYATNEVMLISNSMKSVVTDVNRATINLDVDNYPMEPCKLITDGKLSTILGSEASVDMGSEPTTAGVAYAQIFNPGTNTSACILNVQTSSTGAFAGEQTIINFPSTAIATGLRLIIPATSARRYVRPGWFLTLTGASFIIAYNQY